MKKIWPVLSSPLVRSSKRLRLKRALKLETLENRCLMFAPTLDLTGASAPVANTVPVRVPLALPTPESDDYSEDLTGSGSGSSSYSYSYSHSSSNSSSNSSSSEHAPPTISNFHLVNDTGAGSSDKITSNPTVAGQVDGQFWNNGGHVNIEFDHDADGLGDGVARPGSNHQFNYDPRDSDASVVNKVGSFSLQYRAKEYDASGNLVYLGVWQNFNMTLESANTSEISIVDYNLHDLQSGVSFVDFGALVIGHTAVQQFTIYNLGIGNLELDVNNIHVPQGFQLVSGPSAIVQPNAHTNFSLQADGSVGGVHQGVVSIPNNDTNESPFTFTVKINVQTAAPEIDLHDPEGNNLVDGTGDINFGSTVVGASISKKITITNVGDATLTIDPTTLHLPSGFSLVGTYLTSVLPGQSTYLNLQAGATSEGTYSGMVSFSDNDSDESPFNFTIHATVNPNPSSPAVINIAPANTTDTGSSRIGLDPRVKGTVVGDFSGGSVVVEFDHNNDGQADGSASFTSTGANFVYDPRIASPWLTQFSGWLHMRYRVIHTRSPGNVTTSNWREFSFIVDQTASAGPLSINNLHLDRDTGDSNTDRKTITPTVVGTVVGDMARGSARIEFAPEGSNVASQSIVVNSANRKFSFDPRVADSRLLGKAGESVVRYRLVQLSANGATVSSSLWVNFAIMLEAAPEGQFIVNDLKLSNDDGTSNVDGFTTDPTLQGHLAVKEETYDPLDPAHAVVQFDLDNDGVFDQSTVADGLGNFTYRPSGLHLGLNTIGVRSLQWDVTYGTYLVGSTTFTNFHLVVPKSPGIVDFHLMADTGISANDGITDNSSVSGKVSLDGTGIANTHVYFHINGSGSSAGSVFTDSDGAFKFTPSGLDAGTVTITAESLYWDSVLNHDVYSAPVSLTFTYAPPAPPSIDWMDIAVDNGASAFDRVTSLATVVGQLESTAIRNQVFLEFDTNNDNLPDGYAASNSVGAFSFTPFGLSAGQHVIKARTKQWLDGASSWNYSAWTSTTFSYQPASSLIPQVAEVHLAHDDGINIADHITSDPIVVGSVGGDSPGKRLIDIDINGDNVVDAQTITDAKGTFTYVPIGWNNGAHTIRARTRYWDQSTSTGVLGDWKSLNVTLVSPSNVVPQIDSFRLYSDSGTSATDGHSKNPLLVGQVSNVDGKGSLLIQVDWNDDGIPDGYTYSDEGGRFFALPNTTNFGTVTTRVRAVEYDPFGNVLQYSNWNSYSFVYEDEPQAAAIIASAQWTPKDLTHSTGTLTGQIIDDGSLASVEIDVDTNGDHVSDAITVTNWFGQFSFTPPSANSTSVSFNIRTRERTPNGQVLSGNWQAFTFANPSTPINLPPSVQSLVATSGDSSSKDSSTHVTGMVSNQEQVDGILVQYDSNGDGAPDGSVLTDEGGSFNVSLQGLGIGAHSIAFRAKEFDANQGIIYGSWQSLTFTTTASTATQIHSISLVNDTGSNTTDGATADPKLHGEVKGANLSNVLIFFDENGDGIPDGNATTNASGNFTYLPKKLDYGVSNVVAWIAHDTSSQNGSANSIRFVYAVNPDDAATQSTVSKLASYDATWRTSQANLKLELENAAAVYRSTHNSAEGTYESKVNTITAAYNSAVQGAESAYASTVAAAQASYASAIANSQATFQSNLNNTPNLGTTNLPVFVWPASPPTNSLVIPDDASQPSVPKALKSSDLPADFLTNDAATTSSKQQLKNAASQASQTSEGQFQLALHTANAAQDVARQSAEQAYRTAVATAQQSYDADVNNLNNPAIDVASAETAYNRAVQAAYDQFDQDSKAILAAHADYFYWTGEWPDGVDHGLPPSGGTIYSGWDDGWRMGHMAETPRDYGDAEEHFQLTENMSVDTVAYHTAIIKAAYDADMAAAKDRLNAAGAAAYRAFADVMAAYDHWKSSVEIAAKAKLAIDKANAKEVRDKAQNVADYNKAVAAANAEYQKAVDAYNAAIQSSGSSPTTSGQTAKAGFYGTPATASAATSSQDDADLEAVLAPRRALLDLHKAQANRDSDLRIAQYEKDDADAIAAAEKKARIAQINAAKEFMDKANDANLVYANSRNLNGMNRAIADSTAAKTHTVNLSAIQITYANAWFPLVEPFYRVSARIDGDAVAYGWSAELEKEALTLNHSHNPIWYGLGNTLNLDQHSENERSNKDFINNRADAEKAEHLAKRIYLDKIAEALNVYDTKFAAAAETESREASDADAILLEKVAQEEQTVANAIVPEEQSFADFKATAIHDRDVAKATHKRDDQKADDAAQANLTSQWAASQNTPWSDYQNKVEQSEKIKKDAEADAELKLEKDTADEELVVAKDVDSLVSSTELTEVAAEVSELNKIALAFAKDEDDSTQAIADCVDEMTDVTETYRKQLNLAEQTRDDDLTENIRVKETSFESAKGKFLRDQQNAANNYTLALESAAVTRGFAAAIDYKYGHATAAQMDAANQQYNASMSIANAVRSAAMETASTDRRTTEGEAIKKLIIDNAIAQKTWTYSVTSAFSAWINGLGGDTNSLATKLKGFDVTEVGSIATAISDNISDVAGAEDKLNDDLATEAASEMNALEGFASTYNTDFSNAETTAEKDESKARSDYEVKLQEDHAAAMAATASGAPNPLSQFQKESADADVTKAKSDRTAKQSLEYKDTAAENKLTTDLNTAETDFVSSKSAADKDRSISESSALKSRTIAQGSEGAQWTVGSAAADLEFDRLLTAVDVQYTEDSAAAIGACKNSIADANVTLARAQGEAAKIQYIGQNSADSVNAANAILGPAQIAYNSAVKAARVKFASDIGDAEIKSADDAGKAEEGDVTTHNTANEKLQSDDNTAEQAFVSAMDADEAKWVSDTVQAENLDAEANSSAEKAFTASTGKATADYKHDLAADEVAKTRAVATAESTYQLAVASTGATGASSISATGFVRSASAGTTLSDSQQGFLDYLTTDAPAHVNFVIAIAQAEADHESELAKAQEDENDEIAQANDDLVHDSATPIATEAGQAIARKNSFEANMDNEYETLLTKKVQASDRLDLDYAASDHLLGVEEATAFKAYIVALAGLADDVSTDATDKAFKDAIANAVYDDAVRRADADYTAKESDIAAFDNYTKDAAQQTDSLSHGMASIDATFVDQIAHALVHWNDKYDLSIEHARSTLTTSDDKQSDNTALANYDNTAGDYSAQKSALSGMLSRSNNADLASQLNLANQRSSWWAGVQAALNQRIADTDAADSALTTAINATDQTEAAADDAALITYADATANAQKANEEELADHLQEMVNTIDTAWKTASDQVALAAKTRDIAIAAADRDFAINGGESQYASAKAAAISAYSSVESSANSALETAKTTATKILNEKDADSQKKLDDAVALASKNYDDAVDAAYSIEQKNEAIAEGIHTLALASADKAFEDFEATTWANQLTTASNGSSDPWVLHARNIALADAAAQVATSTADVNRVSAEVAGKTTYLNALADAQQEYKNSNTLAEMLNRQSNATAERSHADVLSDGSSSTSRTQAQGHFVAFTADQTAKKPQSGAGSNDGNGKNTGNAQVKFDHQRVLEFLKQIDRSAYESFVQNNVQLTRFERGFFGWLTDLKVSESSTYDGTNAKTSVITLSVPSHLTEVQIAYALAEYIRTASPGKLNTAYNAAKIALADNGKGDKRSEAVRAWRLEAQQRTGEAAALGVEAYFAFLSIVNEGADLVVTVTDLSQGKWQSMIGLLPFISAGGVKIVDKLGNTRYLDNATVNKIRNLGPDADPTKVAKIIDEAPREFNTTSRIWTYSRKAAGQIGAKRNELMTKFRQFGGEIRNVPGTPPKDEAGNPIFGKYFQEVVTEGNVKRVKRHWIELYAGHNVSTEVHELLHFEQALINGQGVKVGVLTGPEEAIERDVFEKMLALGFEIMD